MIMTDIEGGGKDQEQSRKELLEHLNKFEENDEWSLIAWRDMHCAAMRWASEPQELSRSDIYKVLKSWLKDIVPVPLCVRPDGAVVYLGCGECEECERCGEDESCQTDKCAGTCGLEALGHQEDKQVNFSLWLLNRDQKHLCIICYGEHTFDNEAMERHFGRAEYTITFQDPVPTFLVLLRSWAGERASAKSKAMEGDFNR